MTETAGVGAYDFSTAVTSDIKEAGTLPEEVTENIFVSKIVYNYSGQLPATASIRLNVGNANAASNDTDNSKNTAADNTTAGADNTAAASAAVSETPKTADMTSMCAVLFIFMTAAVGMTVIVSMVFKIKKERRFMK